MAVQQNFAQRPLELGSIRLLEIHPAPLRSSPIVCDCVHYSLNRPPPGKQARNQKAETFVAVSYTWGSPTLSHTITINGLPFPVTHSAREVLASARASFLGRIRVWIDLVSINQKDDEEKKHQIPLMGEIYSRASQVLAWVGVFGVDFVATCALVKVLDRLYKDFHDDLKPPYHPFPPEAGHVRPDGASYGVSANGILELTNSTLESPVWTGLRKFVRRPWFRRIWVYQEAVLAAKLTMTCSDTEEHQIDFDIFARVIHWLMHSESYKVLHHRDDPAERVAASEGRPVPIPGLLHISRVHQTRYAIHHEQRFLPLEEHVAEQVFWEATEPRDQAFAVRAMIPPEHRAAIVPDYKTPTAEVYTRLTRHVIESTMSLQLICAAGLAQNGSVTEVPSWVPDLTARRKYPPVGSMGEKILCKLNCSLPWSQCVSFSDTDGSKLYAQGYIVGRIERIGPICEKAMRQSDWLEKNKTLFKWVEKSLKALKPVNDSGIYRTLLCGITENCPPNAHLLGYDSWHAMLTYKTASKFSRKYYRAIKKLAVNLQGMYAECVAYSEVISVRTTNLKLAKTTRSPGSLAMVPPNSKVGDVVVALPRCAVPLVMRESSTCEKTNIEANTGERLYLVGGCYVDDVADETFEGENVRHFTIM